MGHRASCAIEIDAPIEVTWAAMLDFDAYADWNPFVIHVACARREAAIGDIVALHVRWADGGEARSREQITELRSPAITGGVTRARLVYRFKGTLDALHLVRGKRLQELEQSADGPTRYRTDELFHGALASLLPLAKVQDGFERHAAALKRRAEALAGR